MLKPANKLLIQAPGPSQEQIHPQHDYASWIQTQDNAFKTAVHISRDTIRLHNQSFPFTPKMDLVLNPETPASSNSIVFSNQTNYSRFN
ncbi:hypothetical protein [Legionella moravica]|nr:hypothetical protein [Legionella moravica]